MAGLEVVAAEAQGCSQKGGLRALVAVGEGVVADHAVAQAAGLGDVALVEVPATEGLPGLSRAGPRRARREGRRSARWPRRGWR